MRALYRGWVEEALAVAGVDKAEADVHSDWHLRDRHGQDAGGEPGFAVVFETESAAWAFLAGLGAVQERSGGFDAVTLARHAEADGLNDHLVHVLCFPGWTLSDR